MNRPDDIKWQADVLPVLALSLTAPGAPAACRLACPGFPDHLQSDGQRLVWTLGGAVWSHTPGAGVHILCPSGPLEAVQPGRQGWSLQLEGAVWHGDPISGHGQRLDLDVLGPDHEVLVGANWLLLSGPEGRRLIPVPGAPACPPLPSGALQSPTLAPWADGAGLIWVDDVYLYRLSASTRPAAVGQMTRVDAFLTGPLGAAVFVGPEGHFGLAARHSLVVLARPVDLESVRFSPDGTRILAATPEGTAELDLRSGAVLRTWSADLLPAGYAPEAVLFHEEHGRLVDATEGTLLAGLAMAGAAHEDRLLAGPGGSLWDLARGLRRWPWGHVAGGLTALCQGRVAHLDNTLHFFDLAGQETSTLPHPLRPEDSARGAWDAIQEELDEEEDFATELRWIGDDRLSICTLEGRVLLLNTEDGSVLLDSHLAGDTPDAAMGAAGLLLQTGEELRLWPDDTPIPAPRTPVSAQHVAGASLVRAWQDRLESVPLSQAGHTWHVDGLEIWQIAGDRLIFAADGDDLLVLDGVTGDARHRLPGLLEDGGRILPLAAGRLAIASDPEAPPRLTLVDGLRGHVLGSWPVPAEGAALIPGLASEPPCSEGDWLWAWTEDGSLLALLVPSRLP